MELRDKKILVVGLGRSGQESAAFLHAQGAMVSISETAPLEGIPPAALAWVEENRIPLEAGGHTVKTFLGTELIVVSPGVPLDIEPIRAAEGAGIPIIGEIELAARFMRTPMVAVTGTNGKSTTTTLIGHILSQAGKDVFVGGNIGAPLIGYAGGPQDKDFAVVEISSFQLDTMASFRPRVALLLNITEDHLDRYASFEDYVHSKFRVFANQSPQDTAILNRDDPVVMAHAHSVCSRALTFGHRPDHGEGAYLDGSRLICKVFGEEDTYSLDELHITGQHNLENAMAAVLAARACGCDHASIQEALNTFRGLPHRTEFVCEVGGVRFYDDSKGTNVGSVVKSLAGFERPVVLIAGGRDKGGSYDVLQDLVREKVKALVLIGEARERIRRSLGDLTLTLEAESLPEAVRIGYGQTAPGDVVLLSPACSSFDMFRNYAERGDVFQKAALDLERRQATT